MTLSPVFRSEQAVRLLAEHGIWERMLPTVEAQRAAVEFVQADLEQVIGPESRLPEGQTLAQEERAEDPGLVFLQDYFFLTFFLSLFESLGIDAARLPFYAQLNFCIKGTITAADNIFDGQDKRLLPLRSQAGARYCAILQLMCFERLTQRAGDRAVQAGLFTAERFERANKSLLDRMATIGALEGSEEGGVDAIPEPLAMIELVHRVRGGMLFGLAFAAPLELEQGEMLTRLRRAEPAVAQLGTAFQIVDDLTDFEFDLKRRTHNLLVSQIHHEGTEAERALLAEMRAGGGPESGSVETHFAESARATLEHARREARAALATLAELGFWFPAALADEVVHAIVGLDGVARMESLTAGEPVQG